jgi:hypothetical protein
LLFSENTIIKVLEKQKAQKDFPTEALNNMIFMYKTIGKLTIRKLKKEINTSGVKCLSFRNITNSRFKKVLIKLPFLEEYFAGSIVVELLA